MKLLFTEFSNELFKGIDRADQTRSTKHIPFVQSYIFYIKNSNISITAETIQTIL